MLWSNGRLQSEGSFTLEQCDDNRHAESPTFAFETALTVLDVSGLYV